MAEELVTRDDLNAVVTRLDKISTRLESTDSPEDSAELRAQVEQAVKWASPWRQLIGFVAFLVVGAVSVFVAMRDYAKEQVVDTVRAAHKAETNPVEPSVQTVKQLKEDVKAVKTGVDELVQEKTRQKEMEAIELELGPHWEQYQQQLQEWSARKALRPNRNPGPKPLKTDRHIELEAALKKAANK